MRIDEASILPTAFCPGLVKKIPPVLRNTVKAAERRSAGSGGATHQLIDRMPDERGPDDDLRLQFEAVSRFDEEEKRVVRALLEGMILKHEVRRWQNTSTNGGERK